MTDNRKDAEKAQEKAREKAVRDEKDVTVDTNAGPDAKQGTIADQKVEGTAPERDLTVDDKK